MRKRDCTTMHDSCPPPKKNAISLLQMQICPQSNAKKEIRFFVSKIAKSNSKSLQKKKTQTKFLFYRD
jgi:hypothetical protein